MKKLIKKLFTLFLILIIAGIAFSCGSNSGKSDSDDSSEQVTAEESQGAEAEDTADTDSEDADAQNAETQDDGASAEVDQTYIDPDFKAFMDSYEEFWNEYVDFMVKYESTDTADMEMLADYSSLMSKMAEYETKLEAYDTNEMTTAEFAYYNEVMARVYQKMAEAGM